MAITWDLKAAPFGKGTATGHLLLNGTPAMNYEVNLVITADSQIYDARQLQYWMTKQGFAPGKSYVLTGYTTDLDYIISKISYAHERAYDAASGYSNLWSAILYVEPDPTRLEADVSFQGSHYQETVTLDQKTGDPIVNKAGDPFLPAIEENKGRLRLEVTKRFLPPKFDVSQLGWALYSKSASSVGFTYLGQTYAYDKNQLYCVDVRAPLVWDPIPHLQVTMAFEVDLLGAYETGVKTFWTRHPINQGRFYKDSNGTKHPCSAAGVLHGGVGQLDANGAQLPDGAIPLALNVETIPEYDFTSLKIFPGK